MREPIPATRLPTTEPASTLAAPLTAQPERGHPGFSSRLVEQAPRWWRQVLLWDKVKDKLKRKATELSLEEQQKLCIARLIPVKPRVLLMDEPCSALDPKGAQAVEELIWALSGEYTILIVTHKMAQVRRASVSGLAGRNGC